MQANLFITHVTVISQPKEGKKPGVMVEYVNLDSPSSGISDGFPTLSAWLGIENAKSFRGIGFYKGTFNLMSRQGAMQARLMSVEFAQAGMFAAAK